jgi:hypothetical protein
MGLLDCSARIFGGEMLIRVNHFDQDAFASIKIREVLEKPIALHMRLAFGFDSAN